MRTLVFLVISFLPWIMGGCSYKINDKGGIVAHKVAVLPQGEFLPSLGQLGENRVKVLIFPLTNKAPKAKQAGAGEAASGVVEQSILGSGNVEIDDRSSLLKLQDEIALAEMSGKAPSSLTPDMADFAVMGDVNSVTYQSFYWPMGKPGYMVLDIALAKATKTEPQKTPMFEYTVGVQGDVKILKLPEAKIVKTIPFDHSRSVTKTAGHIKAGPFSLSTTPPNLTPTEEQGLISGAVIDGIVAQQNELKSFFTKRGYVVEKRLSANEKETIFLVSLGADNGMKEGQKVTFFTHQAYTSPITHQTTLEEIALGQGEVADVIKGGECWIHVGDKQLAQKIKYGDLVKRDYHSWW